MTFKNKNTKTKITGPISPIKELPVKTPSHYYSKRPESEPKEIHFNAMLLNNRFKFTSMSGIFSKSHIDAGALLLIASAEIKPTDLILDLGCGYGAVGIVLAKAYGCNAILSDINPRAITAAKKNILSAKLEPAKVKAIVSDSFAKIRKKFDVILFNPPQSAGLNVCKKLISEGCKHLNPSGIFYLVARHNKGGSRLSKYLEECTQSLNPYSEPVKTVAKKGSFRVYYTILAPSK